MRVKLDDGILLEDLLTRVVKHISLSYCTLLHDWSTQGWRMRQQFQNWRGKQIVYYFPLLLTKLLLIVIISAQHPLRQETEIALHSPVVTRDCILFQIVDKWGDHTSDSSPT